MRNIIINIFLISSLFSIQLLAKVNAEYCDSEKNKDTYYLTKNSRTYVAYQNINSKDVTAGATTVGYDYLIGEGNIKPFIGAMIGFSSYNVDTYNVELADTIYGGQAGISYNLDKRIALDAGYRFVKSGMNDTISISSTPLNLELEDISGLYFGLNYNF